MSDGRKRLSGRQYATLREEKELKNKKEVESTKKINEFFQSTSIQKNSLATNVEKELVDFLFRQFLDRCL